MKRKKAFTLVELLVVISIIALLMAILMPGLGKARKLAQGIVCRANLHSIAQVLFLYSQDNEDKLTPDWWSFSYLAARNMDVTQGDVMWHYCAQRYWTDPKILFCPLARKVASVDGTAPDPRNFPEWGHTFLAWYTPWAPPLKATGKPCMSSYGVNDWASIPYREDPTEQANAYKQFWGTVNQVKGADRIPMVFDSAWYSIMPTDTSKPSPDGISKFHNPYYFGPASLPRHNGGINTVFLDGSVRRVGIRELWTLKWNKTFNTENDMTKSTYLWPAWIKSLPP